MFEERTYQFGIGFDLLQLFLHPRLQFFALPERASRDSRAFGVAPHEFVGIELGGVARQVVQRELAPSGGHIRLEHPDLVRRQAGAVACGVGTSVS